MNKILRIENFHLGYGNEEVLFIKNLEINVNSITTILGPSGGGKSSLFKAILKQNISLSYWQKGEIFLKNNIVDKNIAKKYISQVPQKARLYTNTIIANFLDGIIFKQHITIAEKRILVRKLFKKYGLLTKFDKLFDKLAIEQSLGIHKILLIVKAMIRNPKLLLLDEILANTSVKDELLIISLIKKLKKYTTIILITHNKEEAKELCDSIALISGGILHEHSSVKTFFKCPKSTIGKEFLESGSAWYSNFNNGKKNIEDKLTALRRFSSMCEFYWVISNKLGGMQRPGLMTDINDDIKIMQQLGVDTLVTLQEKTLDSSLLKKYQIKSLHFPIPDMSVPDIKQTFNFIKSLHTTINSGKSIIYHCKAGMGRTGTMLACHLIIWANVSAIQAIEKVRRINYKYIQTRQQMHFVSDLENYKTQKIHK